MNYQSFLAAKAVAAPQAGFAVDPSEVHPILKPHQRDMVCWAVAGGRRAIFCAFGLGKTLIQLETVRLTLAKATKVRTIEAPFSRGLIILPLGVRQEFKRDARDLLGIDVQFIRTIEEAQADGIYLTNYETVRDGKLDPRQFTVVSLDEASVLRGFGGTKTFREFMRLFEGSSTYRFVATATPSPNEFIELLAYAAFLDVMDVGQAKTRFFKRDSTNADNLTLHAHKAQEFWHWVASWAIFVQKPSDLGHSDEGYDMPPLQVHWHELPSDHLEAEADRNGQHRLIENTALGVVNASKEKRRSLTARIERMVTIVGADDHPPTDEEQPKQDHWIIWHDLEIERDAIEQAIPHAVTVYGNQDLDERERAIIDFSDGKFPILAAKPVIAGSGCNFQRHCHQAIFLGIGFKFNDFIQAVHRIQRFLQTKPVQIHLIYTEAEREVRATLERKWQQHNELVAAMTGIIREHGLAHAGQLGMQRAMGVERTEVVGARHVSPDTDQPAWVLVNNDTVAETARMEENSAGLIVTSIPFSNQYEYSPNYADFGHTDNNAHFWQQMDYLVPELLRVLQPGRVAAIHVKDRITPGGVNGFGFQTVQPFSDECTQAFQRHGFAFIARKTIVTDVVRENNQTYRLGWTEQCKDGSRMGAGMPEYVLLFRKPPTDRSNGYADTPVEKLKPLCDDNGAPAAFDPKTNWKQPIPGTGYSRAKWQFDAHGYTRSSGDRLLSSAELAKLPHEKMFKIWRERSTNVPYAFQDHVAMAEELDRAGRLPATFMLFPPHSWHPDVWTDIARMRTLNSTQAQKNREMHLCPLQFDIVDRLITQFSNPGDVVFDPFSGIGTVPYCAVKQGRRGRGHELATGYFHDSIIYLRQAEAKDAAPSLFDLLEAEATGTYYTPPAVAARASEELDGATVPSETEVSA